MNRCPKCLYEGADNAKFCIECGNRLPQEALRTVAASAPFGAKTTKPVKTLSGGWIAIIVISAVLFCCFGSSGIFFLIGLSSSVPSGETSSQSQYSDNTVSTGGTEDNKNPTLIEGLDDPTLEANFVAACDAIGIDSAYVINWMPADDEDNTNEYWFSYKNAGLKVLVNEDKSISEIYLGAVILYAEGETPLHIGMFLVDHDMIVTLQFYTEDYVLDALTDPDTADFPSLSEWNCWTYNNYYVVSGYVDTKSPDGTWTWMDFYFEYSVVDGTFDTYYCVIDGSVMVGSQSIFDTESISGTT